MLVVYFKSNSKSSVENIYIFLSIYFYNFEKISPLPKKVKNMTTSSEQSVKDLVNISNWVDFPMAFPFYGTQAYLTKSILKQRLFIPVFF